MGCGTCDQARVDEAHSGKAASAAATVGTWRCTTCHADAANPAWADPPRKGALCAQASVIVSGPERVPRTASTTQQEAWSTAT